MSSRLRQLKDVFTDLNGEENRPMSHGIPRLDGYNDAVDLTYLRYKLRLYTRYHSYSAAVGTENLDLVTDDFTEMKALLDRRPELLGMDPVCATYWRTALLQQKDYTEVDRSDFYAILSYAETYAEHFELEERIEILQLIFNYSARVTLFAQPEMSIDNKIIMLRTVMLEYGNGAPRPGAYINEGAFQVPLYLLARKVRLPSYFDFISTDGKGRKINKLSEWVEEFGRRYIRYLRPSLRNGYRKLLKLVIHLDREEYRKGMRLALGLSIPGNHGLNHSIKRLLFTCVFMLRYHGDASDRRVLKKAVIDPDVVLERMRKQLGYFKEQKPEMINISAKAVPVMHELRKLNKLYKLKENFPLSPAAAIEYRSLKRDMKAERLWGAYLTSYWVAEQLALLPTEPETI